MPLQDSTVPNKPKVPDALKQGHLLLLEGSLEQAIKSYQQVLYFDEIIVSLLLLHHYFRLVMLECCHGCCF